MSRNWAIAVGINHYDNLRDLKYAQRDAETMASFCREIGFEQVVLFTESAPPIPTDSGPALKSQPTLGALLRFLRVRFEDPFLQPEDNLWFFFAGHGKRDRGRDYLMPLDGDPGDVERTAISIRYLSDRLRRCGAGNVIMMLDACRGEGDRDGGAGIGWEKQQGIVTLFACSPHELSYEIDELQAGAFTYALLQGLRIEGEGNCATVERLYQHLRYQVPEINRRFKHPQQTPYAIVEPATKLHLILLPRQATVTDATPLKIDAFEAETRTDLNLAEELWKRVLAVSPVDPQAIAGLQRIAIARMHPSPETTTPPKPRSLDSRGSGAEPKPMISPVNRRKFIYGSASVIGIFAAVVLGRSALQAFNSRSPDPSPSVSPTAQTFSFEVVTVNETGNEIDRQTQTAELFQEDLGDGILLDLVKIPAGEFMMGSPPEEEGFDDERPQHQVTIAEPFWMGRYQVTQAQWRAVANLPRVDRDLEPDPSYFKGDKRPVERISWYEAVEFCARLSQKTGRDYRLPSEAEWEYACRAGTTTPFHFGPTITTDLANYRGIDWDYEGTTYSGSYGSGPKGIFREETTEVGSFDVANAFGLCDMHGNVWEWCADLWHENYEGAPKDGTIWEEGGNNQTQETRRLLRGGSWISNPRHCRSAFRDHGAPDGRGSAIGFRVCCGSPR